MQKSSVKSTDLLIETGFRESYLTYTNVVGQTNEAKFAQEKDCKYLEESGSSLSPNHLEKFWKKKQK